MFVKPLREYFLARTALAGNQYRRGRSGDAIGLGQQPYDRGILGDKLYGRRLTGCMGRIAGRGDPRWINLGRWISMHSLLPFTSHIIYIIA